MNGWVIVYLPGGDIYDMLDEGAVVKKRSFRSRVMRGGVKTFLAAAQLYWWLRT